MSPPVTEALCASTMCFGSCRAKSSTWKFPLYLSIFLSALWIHFGAAVMLSSPFQGNSKMLPGSGLKVSLTFFCTNVGIYFFYPSNLHLLAPQASVVTFSRALPKPEISVGHIAFSASGIFMQEYLFASSSAVNAISCLSFKCWLALRCSCLCTHCHITFLCVQKSSVRFRSWGCHVKPCGEEELKRLRRQEDPFFLLQFNS